MRIILYFIAILQMANGLLMIVTPEFWYNVIPGALETGAFNGHFARDLGFAFLAAGISLVLAARANVDIGRLWPAAVFLGGHATLHLFEMVEHGPPLATILRDMVLIIVPHLTPLAIILIKQTKAREITP